ncbi:MAG: cobalamin B12-binding domain-containing protein [Deltaproteobacteria bacterium]|nr:cobalamin B12-binding domain-containing protein [Deltaproteobacteria bacterium]
MSAILFVHVPRITGGRREIMVMPQGIIPLAGIADNHGVPARIMHTGLGGLDHDKALLAHTASLGPSVILFTLHWHQQASATIRAISLFASRFPGTPIIAGGLTASFFAHELLALAPGLAAVVRGDGEAAVATITQQVKAGRQISFERVPNAVWRDARGGVRDNGISFALDARRAARLEHARFDLLTHPREYLGARLYADFYDPPGGVSPHSYGPAFFYNPGRGCTFDCPFCGGSRSSQATNCGRKGYFFYGLKKIVRDLAAARRWGLTTWRVSFDPGRRRTEWPAIFRAVAHAGNRWRIVFDAWTPPTPAMIDAMAGTALAGSVLVLSPETGNETLRVTLKGASHTDARYEESIASARRRGLGVHVFVSAGLPRETKRDVGRTEALVRHLRTRYGVEVTACPMELDPGSPMFLRPERHSVRLLRRSFEDFMGPKHAVGYETSVFGEDEILANVRFLQETASSTSHRMQ